MNSTSRFFSFIIIIAFLAACTTAPVVPTPNEATAASLVTEVSQAATEIPATLAAPASTEPAQPDGCLGSSSTALVDLDCRQIRIATENAYLPFNYIEISTGEAGGWDYDTWDALCELLHCTPVFNETAWEGLIQSVADGQNDAAANGVTINDERRQLVDFSDGYIRLQQRLLVRQGETRFESIETFAADPSLVIGTQTGTTNYETAVEYLSEDRIKAFEQYPFAIQALLASDVDAVIIDEVVGLGYLGQDANVLELVGPSINSDDLGFVFTKGSDLVEPVNLALAELKKNGTLEAINLKYFGPDFQLTYDEIQ